MSVDAKNKYAIWNVVSLIDPLRFRLNYIWHICHQLSFCCTIRLNHGPMMSSTYHLGPSQQFGEFNHISGFKKLQRLLIAGNPVTTVADRQTIERSVSRALNFHQ